MTDSSDPSAIVIRVPGLPPCKQIHSVVSAAHPHRDRVSALLVAASSVLPSGFIPLRGPVSLSVTLYSPTAAPPGDVTNFLGGIADVLQWRANAPSLGELAAVAVYQDDLQIRRVAFEQTRAEELRYELRIEALDGPELVRNLQIPVLGFHVDVKLVGIDELAIEFTNAMLRPGLRGKAFEHEDELVSWLTLQGVIEQPCADDLQRQLGTSPEDSLTAFTEAQHLATVLDRLFSGTGSDLDKDFLNLLWRRCVPDAVLNTDAVSDAEIMSFEARGLFSLLGPVLSSAIRLMRPSLRPRLRRCADARCTRLFLDKSKNGTRLWCSMDTCGSRAKVRAFRLRNRAIEESAVTYVVT